jgi:hypothetical protein
MTLAKLAKQLIEHRKQDKAAAPKGWLTVKEIQDKLGFLNYSSTSSKAKQLYDKGLLCRTSYQVKAFEGKRSWAFVYQPKKPLKSFDEVMMASRIIGQDAVPKGWISATDFCKLANVSRSAVFQMAERHSLERKNIRIRNGICGIKPVTHFRLANLKKLHHLSA